MIRIYIKVDAYTGPGPDVGVVNGQPLPSTQYTRAAPALPGGGGVDVGNVGMKDSAVYIRTAVVGNLHTPGTILKTT